MSGGLRKENPDLHVRIPRKTIRDQALSWKARGLLGFLLDLPDGWDVRAEWLETQGPDGRDAVRTGLRELRKRGYYRVERRRLADGRFEMGTAVSATAREDWAAEYAAAGERAVSVMLVDDEWVAVPGGVSAPPRTAFPTSDNPAAGEPASGEPAAIRETQTREREGTTTTTAAQHVVIDSLALDLDLPEPPSLRAVPDAPAVVVEPKAAPKTKRGTRVESWAGLNDSLRAWAAAECPLVDVEFETRQFVDHWATTTRNPTKLDWDRTWKSNMERKQKWAAERLSRSFRSPATVPNATVQRSEEARTVDSGRRW